MQISLLGREEITEIYNTKMIYDFPPMELKPLPRILDAYDKNLYECYALTDDENNSKDVLGYAFFVKMDNHFLFDYFAVTKDKRNGGLGSTFLGLLRQKFADSDSVIGEVEDPDYAENEEARDLQTRRLNFYLRNGYINTGIKVLMFGVDYIVLEMDLGKNHDNDTIARLYEAHYKAMLPEEMYKEKVKIKNALET